MRGGYRLSFAVCARDSPLAHASPKPELVQKSLEHLLAQWQVILTCGAKVSLGESEVGGVQVNRDSREIEEEIPLFLVQSWLCSASENCTSATESKGNVYWQLLLPPQ